MNIKTRRINMALGSVVLTIAAAFSVPITAGAYPDGGQCNREMQQTFNQYGMSSDLADLGATLTKSRKPDLAKKAYAACALIAQNPYEAYVALCNVGKSMIPADWAYLGVEQLGKAIGNDQIEKFGADTSAAWASQCDAGEASEEAVPDIISSWTGDWSSGGISKPATLQLSSSNPIQGKIDVGLCTADWQEVQRLTDTQRIVHASVTGGPCVSNTWMVTMDASRITGTDASGNIANVSFTPVDLPKF